MINNNNNETVSYPNGQIVEGYFFNKKKKLINIETLVPIIVYFTVMHIIVYYVSVYII